MDERIRRALIGGLVFGAGFTLFLLTRVPADKALLLGFTSAILIGGTVYFFYLPPKRRDASGKTTPGALPNGDKIFMQEGASHLWKGDTVGGILYLTHEYLLFQSHSYSLRKHQMQIPLDEIHEVEEDAMLGVHATGIKLTLASGQIVKFQVKSRERWIERLS
ncbi:hypothetical protein HZ996_08210 [Cryomorphaceae bacterium]|nr:hypothetical protein HZ996_08210 [Cryomorphaceae bacterium]